MITIKSCPQNPLNFIGKIAGICWNSDITNTNKNINRAKSCIKSKHDRIMEYIDIVFIIDNKSARCIRELGRHIVGTTYLQSSTRYVNYENFKYFLPSSIAKNEETSKIYIDCMNTIKSSYEKLNNLDVPKEDSANLLPLGMITEIVWKINLRALIHFMNMRMCNRAYKEIRQLCKEIKDLLSNYSDEWKWICDNYFVPNCKMIGYCTEEKCCGMMPKGLEGLKEKIIEDYLSKSDDLKWSGFHSKEKNNHS